MDEVISFIIDPRFYYPASAAVVAGLVLKLTKIRFKPIFRTVARVLNVIMHKIRYAILFALRSIKSFLIWTIKGIIKSAVIEIIESQKRSQIDKNAKASKTKSAISKKHIRLILSNNDEKSKVPITWDQVLDFELQSYRIEVDPSSSENWRFGILFSNSSIAQTRYEPQGCTFIGLAHVKSENVIKYTHLDFNGHYKVADEMLIGFETNQQVSLSIQKIRNEYYMKVDNKKEEKDIWFEVENSQFGQLWAWGECEYNLHITID